MEESRFFGLRIQDSLTVLIVVLVFRRIRVRLRRCSVELVDNVNVKGITGTDSASSLVYCYLEWID